MAATTKSKADGGGTTRHAVNTMAGVAGSVPGVAGDVGARLPEAASTTRDAFDEASRLVRSGSDETLKVVGALSIGFAGGLFVAGANRLLVLAALIPAGLVGSSFIERTDGSGLPSSMQGR